MGSPLAPLACRTMSEEETVQGRPLHEFADPLVGQVGIDSLFSSADEWTFRECYRAGIDKPLWRWHISELRPYQNILSEGAGKVRENVLKRQETWGVAYALILGCAISVLAGVMGEFED